MEILTVLMKICWSCQSFHQYALSSPLGKGRDPSFEQTWISFTQASFMPNLDKIDQVVQEKKFSNVVNVISLFRHRLLLEKGMVLHLNNVDFCFLEKMFSVINAFSQFCYYLPLEKVVALHLNKLERPLPEDAFCGIWLKLTTWFWRRWKW